MKRTFIFTLLILVAVCSYAITSTTYTFVSAEWKSKIGTVVCDGKTDGWTCNVPATDYAEGRTDAEGRLYSQGVGVKTGTSGAGATSVIEFSGIKRIVVNFCQNSSKGAGAINIRVGDGEQQSYAIAKPVVSGSGVYNRDTIFTFNGETGKVSFSVDCTQNGIYINTITIYADNGSNDNPDVSTKIFKIISSQSELKDGDEVMFGLKDTTLPYVMGVFDEYVSRNNIGVVSAKYNADHTIVNEVPEAVYTVETYEGGIAFWDYTGGCLVASGGNPNHGNNNYLTVWDKYVSDSYGDYGVWDVTVNEDMTMQVKSRGVSRSNIIMYNPNQMAGRKIFACYADSTSYTRVSIYKRGGSAIYGDANCDGQVDVGDITTIASFLLGEKPTAWSRENADANKDGDIDVADITATAMIILGKE
ncbi:MAG: dockerin type I repeat-containing protein [Prevotellaceae bacterium]|nr:dockerin type I repeat-containing protein [Prevotellaceae bacterium]